MLQTNRPLLEQIIKSDFGEKPPRHVKISRRNYRQFISSYTVDTIQKQIFCNTHKSPHPFLYSIITPPLGKGTYKEATLLYSPSSFYVRLSYKNPSAYLCNRTMLDRIFTHLNQFPDFFLAPIPQEEQSAKTQTIKIVAYAPKMTTLEANLASDPPDFTKGLFWIKWIASGVKHLHSLGYVHRDLKVENIFIDSNGRPIISDFDYVTASSSNHIDGSPLYLPYELRFPTSFPISFEQLKRGDLFAIGVVFLFIAFGINCDLSDDLVKMQGAVKGASEEEGLLWQKERDEFLEKIKNRNHVLSDLICGLLAPFDRQISIENCVELLQKIGGSQ